MAGRPKFKLETFPLPVLDVKLIETHPILGHFLRSDHTPFWWEDFPAIFTFDTGICFQTYGERKKHLRRNKDTKKENK